MAKLPEGYGAAAPKKGAAIPKYSVYMSGCMKKGGSMKECAAAYKKLKGGKEGAEVYAKKTRRKRAARILRRKKKAV